MNEGSGVHGLDVIGLWKITILRHRVAGRGAVAIQSSLFASKQTGKIGPGERI